MSLSAGTRLGPYEILSALGAGGMGEVYVAFDSRLSRRVALKILPPEVAESAEREKRFEKEARAVAALNHPNIVTVHSVEKSEGIHFITMELVEGKTLSEVIPRNGLPLKSFFDLAIPLANALSCAHEHGITHRDLKPTNIMVTDEGRVKILDFGLAKVQYQAAGSALGELPTQSMTEEGRIVGTVSYMSPEQAEGKAVDRRTDLFSLGIVFYEMLTGLHPFLGASSAATVSAILKDTPRSRAERRRR
jgi:serine/threonine protein kinase